METKSKAQLKREKDLRNTLTNILNHKLIDFKDKYLGAYLKWSFEKLENEIKYNQKLIKTEPQRIVEKNANLNNRFRYTDHTHMYLQAIQRAEVALSRPNLITLESIVDANKGYQIKFEKLIDSLVSFEFNTAFLKVEMVSNGGDNLSFLISNKEIEVEARIIYAEGAINAPHYRFITTMRKK